MSAYGSSCSTGRDIVYARRAEIGDPALVCEKQPKDKIVLNGTAHTVSHRSQCRLYRFVGRNVPLVPRGGCVRVLVPIVHRGPKVPDIARCRTERTTSSKAFLLYGLLSLLVQTAHGR